MATYWSDMCDRPTCVYRAYIDGELAYIGITMSPEGRFSTHRSNKPWWCDVDRIELEWFDDRESAKNAERIAISEEKPIHNVTHTSARPVVVVRR